MRLRAHSRGRGDRRARGAQALRMRRPVGLPRRRRSWSPSRPPRRKSPRCSRVARETLHAGGRARLRHGTFGRRAAARRRHPALDGQVQPHRRGRSASRARARVQPGVTNLRISQHVAPLGLYYAPDPSSQIACSIGGNVAENSGGVHCLKYGLTVHNMLQRARDHDRGRRARARAAKRSMRRATTCWRSSPAPRDCSRSRSRSP